MAAQLLLDSVIFPSYDATPLTGEVPMRLRALIASLTILTLFGCSSDAGTTGATYADVSGSFSGPIGGTSQGVPLAATLTLTITQSSATLGGAYAVTGTINGTTQISGTGTISGTVTSGTNPSVDINVIMAGCSSVHIAYSGAYDSVNHRLTMTGPFYITNPDCSIAVTYALTLVLSK